MSDETIRTILASYAADADDKLVARYHALNPEQIYAAVADVLPVAGARVADIGAGTGRDAAWLAERGCTVIAVEPVTALREAGRALHTSPGIEWLDDRLPELSRLRAHASFDSLILCAVWHHLDEEERATASEALAAMLEVDGRLILSLRHAPVAERDSFPTRAETTIRMMEANGLRLIRRREAPSVSTESRAIGVRWTWLAFDKV